MSKTERDWNKQFLNYMEMIVNSPNYKGLPIERKKDGSLKWIAPAKSKIGQARIEWADKKITELGLSKKAGCYAELMLTIHPTKQKVCQTCGKSMSLYYLYPNVSFLNSLNKTFHCSFTTCDCIVDIWDELIRKGVKKSDLSQFLISKGNLNLNCQTATKAEVIAALESACRTGNKKCLGPGAMSNFPDRYDGFHTYNRCCRALQDTGRSKENMKSYTKDRRAYEYWSDGNIHAANQFMGSSFFDGISADHIGPISLGFVHDPRYLQPMSGGDNSAKRDRLQIIDIENIIKIEQQTGVYPMSWYSKLIWEHIRNHYKEFPEKVPALYRDALKQNMANFMYILLAILENCPDNGKSFLIKAFLEPHFKSFQYSYQFNAKGEIIESQPRHYTAQSLKEMQRYVRIALDSVSDYNYKENRNIKAYLTPEESIALQKICTHVEINADFPSCRHEIVSLMESIEKRIISTL